MIGSTYLGASFSIGRLAAASFDTVAGFISGSTDLEGTADRCRVSLFGNSLMVSALGADKNDSRFLSRDLRSSRSVESGFSLTMLSKPYSTLREKPRGMSLFSTFREGPSFGYVTGTESKHSKAVISKGKSGSDGARLNFRTVAPPPGCLVSFGEKRLRI